MRYLNRRLGIALLSTALVSLLLAASAAAEPELGIELTRDPGPNTVPQTHEDERAVYDITVRNEASPTPAVGTELTCLGTPGDGKSWFGEPPPTFSYQWLRSGADIPGATDRTYVVAAADEGESLQCVVFGKNEPGPGEPAAFKVASQPPLVIDPQPATVPPRPLDPTNSGSRPRIILFFEGGEKIQAGNEITCEAPSGWSGSGIAWSFEWFINGEPGKGASSQPTPTTSKYLVLAEDVPSTVQCKAIATDVEGNRAIAFSTNSFTEPPPGGCNCGPVNPLADTPSVAFSNTTSGPVTVEVELPGGLETYVLRISGTGWTCAKAVPTVLANASATCTRGDALAPDASYPPIELVERPGADAPDDLVTKVSASGGGSPTGASDEDTITVGPGPGFGFAEFFTEVLDELGDDFTQAGGHPFSAGATIEFNQHVRSEILGFGGAPKAVNGSTKVVRTDTPRGFIGNPQAVPVRCETMALVTRKPTGCPPESVVGGIDIETSEGNFIGEPVYAIEPEYGTPAQFAFGITTLNLAFSLTPELRAEDGYAISLLSAPAPKTPELFAVRVTLCGFGAKALGISGASGESQFKGCRQASEGAANEVPLITNPTRCSGEPPTTRISAESWEHPDVVKEATFAAPALTGCDQVPFEPEISFTPSSRNADSPTGLDVELTMPTDGLEENEGIAQANLANSIVTLPAGMSVNPSLAGGLGACSEAEIGLGTNDAPTCPPASKVGTAEVSTPLLEDPLQGSVYVAKQGANPFDSLLALYLVLESKERGITIKIAGEVSPDPVTGQLTASFTENPEAPFSSLALHFNDGPRAPLINPPACGSYAIEAKLSPWTAADPANPTASETVVQKVPYAVNRGPGGGKCPTGALEPTMRAGLTDPTAATSSPFVLNLSRPDGSQRFKALDVTMPPGLTAYLRGIPYCPDEALAAISGALETGAAQLASPACPAASRIGTVTVGAGAGSSPFFLDTGRAYLAGPYKNAPLSLAIVTPAVAGPFDLGSVVVRSAIRIDPATAQVSVVSDPIPTILHGLLLDVREIRVVVDRPGFLLAPTNCDPMAVGATVHGEKGATAQLSERFQVGGCERLGFKPRISLQLNGGVRRGAYQGLTATLRPRPGDANIGRAVVRMPHSAFLAQEHIGTVCTRVQFAAGACPKASVYGTALAKTPLLDYPLQGNVYLRSSDNPLPDLVADLRGPGYQPIRFELVGRTDSVKGGLRNSFDLAPDAPVSYFRLALFGGKKGLIVNSRNVCLGHNRAKAGFEAHNGRSATLRPELVNKRCKGKKGKKGRKGSKRGKGRQGHGGNRRPS